MATRNKSLDVRILEAAFVEFSNNGFQDASLRNIAYRAGISIGAIHTRYRTKDDLYFACISPLFDDLRPAYDKVWKLYSDLSEEGDVTIEKLTDVLTREFDLFMDTLLAHYDESVLLVNSSSGSRLSNIFDVLVQVKKEKTDGFLRSIGAVEIDDKLLTTIIALEIQSFRSVLNSGCNHEDARKYMAVMADYNIAGWAAVQYKVCRFEDGERPLDATDSAEHSQ